MRDYLRRETRAAHDRLDQMAAAMPLSGVASYADFLTAQGEVRLALEHAFTSHAPLGLPAPPRQSMLINEDLRELGRPELSPRQTFCFANAYEALGSAWVVAGSSLGNRAMLSQRRKSGHERAHAFLSDEAMPSYFSRVLGVLETPFTQQEREQISTGAHRTFAIFESRFAATQQDRAA